MTSLPALSSHSVGQSRRAVEILSTTPNRQVGHAYGEGIALTNLGAALHHLGRDTEAVGYLEQARSVFADIMYDDGLGYACFDLGQSLLALGRDQEALASLRESTDWHAAAGNRNRQAFALLALGDAAERSQMEPQGHQAWLQAAAIFDELGDSTRAAHARARAHANSLDVH